MAAGLVTACNATDSKLRSDICSLFSCLRPQNHELKRCTIGLLSFCYVSLARTALKRRYHALKRLRSTNVIGCRTYGIHCILAYSIIC